MRERPRSWKKGCDDTMQPTFPCSNIERTYGRMPNDNEKARRGKGVRCFFQLFFLDSSVTRENDRRRLSCLEQYTRGYWQYRASTAQRVERSSCSIPSSKNYAIFTSTVNSKRYALASGNSQLLSRNASVLLYQQGIFPRAVGYRQANEGTAVRGAAPITGLRHPVC